MDSAAATGDTVHKIGNLALLEAIKDEWKALQSRALHYSQCQTYEYCELVAKLALERGRPVYLITARDSGLLVGVWLLTLQRDGWLRILRPASCGTNEEYSWPLLSADTDELAHRMFHLAATISADRLMIYNLPKSGHFDRAASRLPQKRNIGEIEGLHVEATRFRSAGDVDLAISNDLRRHLRRDRKRLNEKGLLTVGWCRTIEETNRAIDFFMPAKKRWLAKKGRHSPWIGHENVLGFFKGLASRSDLAISPVAAAATFDGNTIAVCLCLHSTRAIEFYIATYDQEFDYFAPGKMLYHWLIGTSIDAGLDADFRILPEPYKKRWPVTSLIYRTHSVYLSHIGSRPSFGEIRGRLQRRLSSALSRVRVR
jgi:CelD/BcsL family acetyltransferase involved in cellulose biosynthesis